MQAICKRTIFILAVTFFLFTPSHCLAATLYFSVTEGELGNVLKVPLVMDEASKLAGLKLTLTYDKQVLEFVDVQKTAATAAFMHIVNDKLPGKLIIVMAAARGIAGKKVVLFDLLFKVTPHAESDGTILSIAKIQLMDEQLKEIQASEFEHTVHLKKATQK